MRDALDPSRKRSELPGHRHELVAPRFIVGEECFTVRVSTCSWLTSIFREVTAGVVMNSEVTTKCAPMSSLFGSLSSCL